MHLIVYGPFDLSPVATWLSISGPLLLEPFLTVPELRPLPLLVVLLRGCFLLRRVSLEFGGELVLGGWLAFLDADGGFGIVVGRSVGGVRPLPLPVLR